MKLRSIKHQNSWTEVNRKRHALWMGTFVLFAVACLILYFLLDLNLFNVLGNTRDVLKKLFLGATFSFLVFLLSRWVERFITLHAHSKATHYNAVRLIRFLALLITAFIAITLLFSDWYTAAVSLGLISLVLGFALQTPILSLIGWFYIIIRKPYQVGDRIQLEEIRGDVVEIGYLDTTLWEFSGDYLTNDLPSGRLIRFPNSLTIGSPVYNYSWDKFPYIWNEIPFHIAYESDVNFVESTLREVTRKVLGPEMPERIQSLKKLIAETPLDEREIQEYPFVCFRTNANTWIEALVVYLVEPKHAAEVRSQIIKDAVSALLREPNRVMFPKSNAR